MPCAQQLLICGLLLAATVPLLIVALPAGDATASGSRSLSADEKSIESINSILEEIREDEEIVRSKRAGSGGFDLLGGLKNQIASIVSKASASLASSSSGASSGSSGHDPHHIDVAHFDPHHLKKSILNTIFQVVKAITGGLTTINGQLIKGSGYAISAGGALVAKSGDAVSNVGKKIALSAELVEPHGHKYPTTGGGGGGSDSGAGIHATLAKLISGASASSSGSSSAGHGHKEIEHGGHVEVHSVPSKSLLHGSLINLITSASATSSSASTSSAAAASSASATSSAHHPQTKLPGHVEVHQHSQHNPKAVTVVMSTSSSSSSSVAGQQIGGHRPIGYGHDDTILTPELDAVIQVAKRPNPLKFLHDLLIKHIPAPVRYAHNLIVNSTLNAMTFASDASHGVVPILSDGTKALLTSSMHGSKLIAPLSSHPITHPSVEEKLEKTIKDVNHLVMLPGKVFSLSAPLSSASSSGASHLFKHPTIEEKVEHTLEGVNNIVQLPGTILTLSAPLSAMSTSLLRHSVKHPSIQEKVEKTVNVLKNIQSLPDKVFSVSAPLSDSSINASHLIKHPSIEEKVEKAVDGAKQILTLPEKVFSLSAPYSSATSSISRPKLGSPIIEHVSTLIHGSVLKSAPDHIHEGPVGELLEAESELRPLTADNFATGYTTYVEPTGNHQSYGPAPSGPSATGAAYLPFDHPTPSGHEQQGGGGGYHAPTADILTDSYQRPLQTHSDNAGGGGGGLFDFKSQAVHSAADALRQILDKLPIDGAAAAAAGAHSSDGADEVDSYSNLNSLDQGAGPELDDRPFHPYDIPSDPHSQTHSAPPPFRPLPPLPAGYPAPINSITHTQIITTAYGGGGGHHSSSGDDAHQHQPITLMDIETNKWQSAPPIGPGVSHHDADNAAISLYHVMSLKNHGIHDAPAAPAILPPAPQPPANTYLPGSAHEQQHEQHQQHHHYQHSTQQQQQQHHQQHEHFDIHEQLLPHFGPAPTVQQLPHVGGHHPHVGGGPAYEIHKSIAYEVHGRPQMQYLPVAQQQQHQHRRLYKVKPIRPLRRH